MELIDTYIKIRNLLQTIEEMPGERLATLEWVEAGLPNIGFKKAKSE